MVNNQVLYVVKPKTRKRKHKKSWSRKAFGKKGNQITNQIARGMVVQGGRYAFSALGTGIGGAIGTLAGPAGTAIGAGVGGALGNEIGGIVSSKAANKFSRKHANRYN